MASSEVSWESAYWTLPSIAIATMTQPSGMVCGFDPSLRIYLRSSPIVCVFDSISIIVRFTAYCWLGHGPANSARGVLRARKAKSKMAIQDLEEFGFLRLLGFLGGILSQTVKLLACSGLPWTQMWACFYVTSYLVVEGINLLDRFATDDREPTEGTMFEPWFDPWFDPRWEPLEKSLGGIAIVLQLVVLAWVDLAVRPSDVVTPPGSLYHALRFCAHLVVFFIYAPLIRSKPDAPERGAGLVFGSLVTFAVVTVLAATNRRYTVMYFLWSILISFSSILMTFSSYLREHVMFCKTNPLKYGNVLVFDFCCRVFCFSLFWYVRHYSPVGTHKPEWAGYLG